MFSFVVRALTDRLNNLLFRLSKNQVARSFLSVDEFAERQPWRSLLDLNSPEILRPHIPVFLAQGALSFLRKARRITWFDPRPPSATVIDSVVQAARSI